MQGLSAVDRMPSKLCACGWAREGWEPVSERLVVFHGNQKGETVNSERSKEVMGNNGFSWLSNCCLSFIAVQWSSEHAGNSVCLWGPQGVGEGGDTLCPFSVQWRALHVTIHTVNEVPLWVWSENMYLSLRASYSWLCPSVYRRCLSMCLIVTAPLSFAILVSPHCIEEEKEALVRSKRCLSWTFQHAFFPDWPK